MSGRIGNKCKPAFRQRVRNAFGDRCEYCGYVYSAEKMYPWMTVDCIVPKAAGGKYLPDNVTLACLFCNSHKGAGEFVGPVRSLAVMEAHK